MSTIGPGPLGPVNLAGSVAGTQQSPSQADRATHEASQRNFQIDQRVISARDLDDVAETVLSRDRDADGRLPYEPERNPAETSEPEGPQRSQRAPDALGERGTRIDFEA